MGLVYNFNRRVQQMVYLKTFFLIFSLILGSAIGQNCVGSLSDDLIQAGTVDIINPGANGRQTLAQSQVLYTIPSWGFQTALSFIDFQYNSSQGLDLTLRGGRIGNTNFLGISVLLLQDRRWDRIKVSYLVNSRKDVWLGSFTYSPYNLNSAQNNSGSLSSQIQASVENWQGDNSNLVFLKAVFLSGIQTGFGNFSLSLTNVTFDKVRGVIGVTLANCSRSLEMVTISYVIFVSPHARFIFDSFAYPGSVPAADYGIIGSSGFVGGASNGRYYGINIESSLLNCQGSCGSPCFTKTNCTQSNGVSSGNDCFICPNNTKYNQTRKACVPVLVSCGPNEQLAANGTCQCIFGFIRLGQLCVSRCGVNQDWNGTECTCSKGNANITNVCRPCPVGSLVSANKNTCECQGSAVFDEANLRCIAIYQCPENSTGVIQNAVYRCKCNADFYASADKCVYCPTPAIWDTLTLTCGCKAPLNFNGRTCIGCVQGQYFNQTSRQCECYTPRVLVNGACQCPNNLIWNAVSGKCECKGKFETLNQTLNQCSCLSPYIKYESGECGLACPENEWWTAGECKCKSPFIRVNGKCTMNCTQNEKWNGIQCVCVQNYFRINGTCATCPIGQFFNSTAKSCQNLCSLNEVINGTTCVCKQNYFRINGVCSQCPIGTGYKASSGNCVACDLNEIQQNSVCVCRLNFYRINGVCGQCPVGTSYNQEKQICDPLCTKQNEVFDGKACVCALGFDRINGTCGQCPSGTSYNKLTLLCEIVCKANEVVSNGSCVCAPGFYKIDGLCGQCAAGTSYNKDTQKCDSICKLNEVFDGTTCVCVLNFYRIKGVCGQCLAGTTYNKLTQACDSICKVNEVFDGANCVCASGFNKINGTCGQCPAGTSYNKLTQVCDSICGANQVFDGAACVCTTGLYRIKGVCGQCLLGTSYNTLTKLCENICKANEIFNATSCVCASGFTLINGVCDKCPVGSYFDETLKKCVVQPTCPLGAEWNQAKLQCQCTQAGVYLINGTCKSCDANAAWNGSRCVCKTGFFLINGKDCLTCDLNSFYNSTLQDCVCNRGFYGDRNLCQKCDATCGRCSGPNANQCLDCADVSLTLSNGVCAKPSQCVAGMYLNGTICRPCSAYCASCTDENTCKQCTSGFSLSSVTLTPTMVISMCEEICGDGKRYEYDCDDGNTVNGDGCNDQCQIETGYTCGGGTTTSKSVCVKLSTPKTVITPKGAVQLSGKVMQGVTLSYLPEALTQGGCPKCSQVLLVSIIQAQVIPSFRVNFLPTTQFKFLIEFDFQGIFGIPPFTFTLRINPDYAKYFSTTDMAQQIQLTVDPAVLARGEEVQDLTIQEILGQKIAISDSDVKTVFG